MVEIGAHIVVFSTAKFGRTRLRIVYTARVFLSLLQSLSEVIHLLEYSIMN